MPHTYTQTHTTQRHTYMPACMHMDAYINTCCQPVGCSGFNRGIKFSDPQLEACADMLKVQDLLGKVNQKSNAFDYLEVWQDAQLALGFVLFSGPLTQKEALQLWNTFQCRRKE